jgi:hypothetical protein
MLTSFRFCFSLSLSRIIRKLYFTARSTQVHQLRYGTLFRTALTMERLFSPCTRYRDMLENQGRLEVFRSRRTEPLQELNLDVSTEELLSAERALTYVDLYAMSGNQKTVLWLTPHAAVVRESEKVSLQLPLEVNLSHSYRSSFIADGKAIFAFADSLEHLLEICDVVLRLLARSVVHSVILHSWSNLRKGASITAPNLAYLMEQCPNLKLLSLHDTKMDENHCRVLGTYSRPDLEIKLHSCKVTRAGASALAEVLGRNQGPTKLTYCDIDCLVLLDGLRGNSRLKSLTPRLFDDRGVAYLDRERLVIGSGSLDDVDRQVLAIAGTLKENTGLVVCDLGYCLLNDEMWNAVCDSLKTNSTLQILRLRWPMRHLDAPLASAVLKSRIQALVDMLKVNMSIHTMRLPEYSSECELFREAIIPYLETNRQHLRLRVRAIQEAYPFAYCTKVLGRALFAGRTDANCFWMLLSGNSEVAFPSTTGTTTPATNLPTPATPVATFNTAAIAAIAGAANVATGIEA